VCSKCQEKTLDNLRLDGLMHGVLVCSKCGTLWQRDINAARNMVIIIISIIADDGRPAIFRPPSQHSDHESH
jgi:transcription elongation factor Elf1